jgi:hypothetical protein
VGQYRIDAMAENWLEKGASHRALAFRIAQKAMNMVEKHTPRPMDWSEVEKVDKMARRSARLDNVETKVNVNLNLVNQRILAMQLADE